MKTNAARILDKLNIEYELRAYKVDLDDLSALSVAESISLAPGQVFKTLVLCGDNERVLFAVLPGNRELDLKALSKITGERKVEPAPVNRLRALTGYVRGAVTVLGASKKYPVYVDEAILDFEAISISGGRRGVQILLKPKDFVCAVAGTVCRIARAPAGRMCRTTSE